MNYKKVLYPLFLVLMATIVLAAKETTGSKIYLMPVLFYGIILGLYELFLIHADMNFRGSHWFGHGLQSVFFMILAIFAVMNVEYFLSITNLINVLPPILQKPIVFQALIVLILNIKIHSTSAVFQTAGLTTKAPAEHWTHTLIISVAVMAVPYIHQFISAFLPSWLQ